MKKRSQFLFGLGILLLSFAICLAELCAQDKMLRGWLSDEDCARGRANSGVFTGTNPTCAKKCVGKGVKIVLILPEEKTILNIENQDAARNNLGNLVEVSGNVDQKTRILHINTLKMLEEGVSMCALPKKKAPNPPK